MIKVLLIVCALQIPPGVHEVRRVTYWAHRYPQNQTHLWQAETTAAIVGPKTVTAEAEGHPIGHRWWVDGAPVKTCGELLLFENGFETGTTEMWTHTEGKENDDPREAQKPSSRD